MRAACACPPCSRSWSRSRQRLAARRLKRMPLLRSAPPQHRLGARTWQLLPHWTAPTEAQTGRRRVHTPWCQDLLPCQEQSPAHRQGQAGGWVAAQPQPHQGSPQRQQGVCGQAERQANMRPCVRLQVHMRQAQWQQQLQQQPALTLGQGAVRLRVTRPPQLHHQGPRRRQRALLAGGRVRWTGQKGCRVTPGHQR